MTTSKTIIDVQRNLYVWLSKFENRSLELIKATCDSLNESGNLQLKNPVWELFWPMVFNGVADHVGNGYYALTEAVCLDFVSHRYYVNYIPKGSYSSTDCVGICFSDDLRTEQSVKMVRSYPLAILKSYPTIQNIVDSFSPSLQEEDLLSYYNTRTRKGIAKLDNNGLTRYFSIPDKMYMRELPSRNSNPEAFAIAYCYSRAINNEGNGIYRGSQKSLMLPKFALPFMLYRVLLIEGMTSKTLPTNDSEYYYFRDVNPLIVGELNRILCNSIKYE